MKLTSFRAKGAPYDDENWGAVDGTGIVSLRGVWPRLQDALAEAPAALERAVKECAQQRFELSDVTLLPPVTRPSKIFCIGLNYGKHAAEAGRTVPPYPSVFMRHIASFVGHDGRMVRPWNSEHYDFEAELAVVIGRAGRHIERERAMEHVAGYTCAQENSVRDFQKHGPQVTPGKNFDASGVLGPWIVTADSMPALQEVRVQGRLNGVEMQNGAIADLMFPVPDLVAYLSSFARLEPGDMILTGTPEGVGSLRKPPVWMKAGDRYEVEITGIGTLCGTVVDESR